MEEITFNLLSSLTMPELLKAGYRREDITNLFETLQSKGFGTYNKGKRGKGCFSYFQKNANCPNEFVVRGRKRYNKQAKKSSTFITGNVSTTNVDNSDSEFTSTKAQTIHALWGLSKNIVENPSSANIGYKCDVFAGQILTLHRIRGGGEVTIECALKNVWGAISDRVNTNIEDVASKLRGHGFCLLNN